LFDFYGYLQNLYILFYYFFFYNRAKQIIMDGAISLAVDTVNEIETRGITMSDSDKSKLVSNILTISVVRIFFFFFVIII